MKAAWITLLAAIAVAVGWWLGRSSDREPSLTPGATSSPDAELRQVVDDQVFAYVLALDRTREAAVSLAEDMQGVVGEVFGDAYAQGCLAQGAAESDCRTKFRETFKCVTVGGKMVCTPPGPPGLFHLPKNVDKRMRVDITTLLEELRSELCRYPLEKYTMNDIDTGPLQKACTDLKSWDASR